MEDMNGSRKHLLGKGQLAAPLTAQIMARQYFLAAVEDQVSEVIMDLRDIVYPNYCETRGRGVPSLAKWMQDHHLVDPLCQPLDWARSCAEHTLYQWALDDRLPWASRIPGRPSLTGDKYGWARCNDLPAFETWLVLEDDAYPLIAGLGELPEYTSYDFLVILANGRLAALRESGYWEIPVELSRFSSLLRITFGPFDFNPLAETIPMARRRIKDELDRGVDSFLTFGAATLADWQGYLEKTVKKDAKHFDWAALHIAGDQTLSEVAVSFGEDSDTVATGVNEVRRLIGLARPAGRPTGICEDRPRRERD